jgi:hypothetical protein
LPERVPHESLDDPLSIAPWEAQYLTATPFPEEQISAQAQCASGTVTVRLLPRREATDAAITPAGEWFKLAVNRPGEDKTEPSFAAAVEITYLGFNRQTALRGAKAANLSALRTILARAAALPRAEPQCLRRGPPAAAVDDQELRVLAAAARDQVGTDDSKMAILPEIAKAELDDQALKNAPLVPCLRPELLRVFVNPREDLKWQGEKLRTVGLTLREKPQYMKGEGALRASHVGFSADGRQAMIRIQWIQHMMIGYGDLYVLDRKGDDWSVSYVQHSF